jgi:hypothetical protein
MRTGGVAVAAKYGTRLDALLRPAEAGDGGERTPARRVDRGARHGCQGQRRREVGIRKAIMPPTPFPARPREVVPLTVREFTCELDLKGTVSIDSICHRFLEDAGRAVVWFIRFQALSSWCERADVADWLGSRSAYLQHACELAATFQLNDEWEFDPDAFRAAVESVAP